MRNPQLFVLSRKIHRILVLGILISGTCMIITGLFLYFHWSILIGLEEARSLHNSLSIIVSIIFGLMIISGTYLFLFPYLKTETKNTP